MGNKVESSSQSTSQWVTIQEASEITGKSINALSLLVRRRRIDRTKKVSGTGQGKWLIHREALAKYMSTSQSEEEMTDLDQSVRVTGQTVHDLLRSMISLEHHEKKRDEWDRERDRLTQGIMMYQYKLEDYERKLKLLPAPVEVVSSKLQEQEAMLQTKDQALQQKEEALVRAQQILKKAKESYDQYKASMAELKARLAEEERAREAYKIQWELAQEELKKPWWKKLFGVK